RVRSRPSRVTRPRERTNPVIASMKVVFPAPFGPIRPTICPSPTTRSTSTTACTPPKLTEIPAASRTGVTGRRPFRSGASGRPAYALAERQNRGDDAWRRDAVPVLRQPAEVPRLHQHVQREAGDRREGGGRTRAGATEAAGAQDLRRGGRGRDRPLQAAPIRSPGLPDG